MSLDYLANSLVPIYSFNGELVTVVNTISYYVKNTKPLIAAFGDIWYDPVAKKKYVFTPSGWVEVTSTATSDSTVTQPTVNKVGDTWYDIPNDILYVWDGTTWIAVAGVLVNCSSQLKLNYSGSVLTFSNKSLVLPYADLVKVTKNIVFVYSELPSAASTLVANYDVLYQELVYTANTIKFTYVLADDSISNTLDFSYSVLTSRLKFPLNKGLELGYSLANPTPVLFSASFGYGNTTILGSSLKLNYSEAQKVNILFSLNYDIVNTVKTDAGLTTSFFYSNTTLSNALIKFGYSNTTIASSTLRSIYSDLTRVNNKVQFGYSNTAIANSNLKAFYTDLVKIINNVQFDYSNSAIVASSLKSLYSDLIISNNIVSFDYSNSAIITSTLKAFYADLAKVDNSVQFDYTNSDVVTSILKVIYTDLVKVNDSVQFDYSDNTVVQSTLMLDWFNTTSLSDRIDFKYEISDKQYVFLEGKFGYSVENTNVQSIDTTPYLYRNGDLIDYIVVNLSTDENSPFWIGDVSLAKVEDYSKFNVGDVISLEFVDQTYQMVVDGKNLSRGDNAAKSCVISFISPAALLDNPFSPNTTKFYNTAVSAKQVVEELLGSVEWNLPDWFIPLTQAQFTGSTPLATARRVVGAVGGLVESMPDGSIVCRKTFPVSIPDYLSADSYTLSDSDLFDVSEQIAPQKIYNRFTLYTNTLASSINDKLEHIFNEGSKVDGVVKAYPSPKRPVTLNSTNGTAIVEDSLGEVIRTETEYVEFKAGKASTQYPIESVVSMEWRTTNLGGITFEGNRLVSAVLAESLLKITYTVSSFDFKVKGTEISQFCLAD